MFTYNVSKNSLLFNYIKNRSNIYIYMFLAEITEHIFYMYKVIYFEWLTSSNIDTDSTTTNIFLQRCNLCKNIYIDLSLLLRYRRKTYFFSYRFRVYVVYIAKLPLYNLRIIFRSTNLNIFFHFKDRIPKFCL